MHISISYDQYCMLHPMRPHKRNPEPATWHNIPRRSQASSGHAQQSSLGSSKDSTQSHKPLTLHTYLLAICAAPRPRGICTHEKRNASHVGKQIGSGRKATSMRYPSDCAHLLALTLSRSTRSRASVGRRCDHRVPTILAQRSSTPRSTARSRNPSCILLTSSSVSDRSMER